MKQEIPNISYERNMNHNYMILSKCDFFGRQDKESSNYRIKMLLENHIPGLLPVTHRLINGESRYYYEINSLQSLDRLYDKKELGYDALRKLLLGCVSLFDKLEEYLLDGAQIIIKPELIYMNVEKMEPYFVCYPEYEGDVRLSFMEFIDELLTRIDHTDERAVMIGYQVYRYTRNPNYVMSEIGRIMEHAIMKMTEETPRPPKRYSIVENTAMPKKEKDYEDYLCADEYIQERDIEQDYPSSDKQKSDNDPKYQSGYDRHKNIIDLAGGIFCIFVSLCAGTIVLGARILKTFQLSENNELYLYGAMAMSMMASVLFLSCYVKKRKQDKELESLKDNSETDYFYHDGSQNDNYQFFGNQESVRKEFVRKELNQKESNKKELCIEETIEKKHNTDKLYKSQDATICLTNEIVEERMLYGRINGKETRVSLDKLPMIVGKLPSVADFVINDTAVSKMHARFEERDGRVYICDLNSTNGTVRNGILLGVNQSIALEPGDRLRFGRTSFTYC